VKVTLIVIALVFIYGSIATVFSDTTIAGEVGNRLGNLNLYLFGYFSYIDFLLLYIFIFLLFTSTKLRKSLDFYLGWMLSLISILFIQAMLAEEPYNGFIGTQVVEFLGPIIGRAGLWILWLIIFALNIIFIFGDRILSTTFPFSINNDLVSANKVKKENIVPSNKRDSNTTHPEMKKKVLKRFKNPFETPNLDHSYEDRSDKKAESTKDFEDDTITHTNTKSAIKEQEEYKEPIVIEEDEFIQPINIIDNIDDIELSDKFDEFKQQEDSAIDEVPTQKVVDSKNKIVENEEIGKRSKNIQEQQNDNTNFVNDKIEVDAEDKVSKVKEMSISEVKATSSKTVPIVKELEENSKILNTIEKGKIEKPTNFKLPPLDFLQPAPKVAKKINEAEIDRKIEELLTKLQMFKVEGDVIRTYSGPLVTTFEFKPAPNVKVSKILGLQDDLAMALRAETIRIQAPIPGRDVVGIEIPNESIETIYLREILESKLFQESKSPLTVALGKDIVGNPFITDIKKLPHLLIAGTTGSGKSVGINAMILSLLYRNDPDHLKLMLIDPKMLEFSMYDDIPHLITPVIIEPAKAIAALANMVGEMERRYKLMAESRTKTIDNYNEKVKKDGSGEPFPYIVVVIDELADLMMNGGKEVELSIARLAQKSRACGIHLIVATQRPSVDVVTGLIKANLPSRLSYRVGQKIDSKVILDSLGAESLLGRGDGLFTPPGTTGLVRIHAPWNSEDEIEEIVEFLKAQRTPEYDESYLVAGGAASQSSDSCDIELDPLFEDAKQVVLTDKKTSISYLQRKLQIGYNRSANIIDQLEAMGILSAPNAKGNREIIV